MASGRRIRSDMTTAGAVYVGSVNTTAGVSGLMMAGYLGGHLEWGVREDGSALAAVHDGPDVAVCPFCGVEQEVGPVRQCVRCGGNLRARL